MEIPTSPNSDVANPTAASRFRYESLLGLSELLCEPTRITGPICFSNINASAEAVYDMVSVPWEITAPSEFLSSCSVFFCNFHPLAWFYIFTEDV